MERRDKIPEPTIARLPSYFRCLVELRESDQNIVSSEEIASRAGVKASQFRKDLSYFGEFGIQGLGYPVRHLLDRIAAIMQLDQEHEVVLVGAGNLGSALAGFPGFLRWGFRIAHIYDQAPEKIGKRLHGVEIHDIRDLPKPLGVPLGIVAVPPLGAREAARLLIDSGVRALLNFTGTVLEHPPEVVVRNVDMTHELAILAYHLTAKGP
ncbi:MAG: redox-sensing transcriptional repressor Rex [Candidatus Eremiobacterota bacterium]